jgi:N-acetylmuramic acid 6-phosphate etherase
MSDLSHLPTEAVNPRTADLSRLPTREALELINSEDQKVAVAVSLVLDEVAQVVDGVAERMKRGGRLLYVGAGTSGRLGVVDASECPPTFGTPPEWVQGFIAGGREAMFRSQEGAEDIAENGALILQEAGLTQDDSVVGITASGRTPYVMGALQLARDNSVFTAGVTTNPQAAMAPLCDVLIAPFVGPEVVTGSTRLKSGTAQKLVLNMISTGVMLRLGRVEGNLMADLRPLCGKLEDRARRLVMMMANVDSQAAENALSQTNNNVREAVAFLNKSGSN